MERIECNTKKEAENKLWIASKKLGEWGENFFKRYWNKRITSRHAPDNLPAELNRIEFEENEKAQRSGVDLIEHWYATGDCHVYEVKTDLQSTVEPVTQRQDYFRTRPINEGASKLDRTKETINPLMEAATGNEAEFENGLLNYFIELKQEWGGIGWFPKLKETAGNLNDILPAYHGKINGRDVVFISVIDGEPLEEDKKFFAVTDQDGNLNLPDGMRSGAGAFIILVPDDVLIRIAENEKEATTGRGYLLPMYKLFERKATDAYIPAYWEEYEQYIVDGITGEETKKFVTTDQSVLKVGKQPNGVTVWPMEPLTIAERAEFIELVETKRFYKRQLEKFGKSGS